MKQVPGRNGGTLIVREKGDPSPNKAGLKPGTLHSKTVIRKWLEAVESAKNPITGQLEFLTQLDIGTLKQIEKMRKGDTVAFRELLDRMEGKPTQLVDIDADINTNINLSDQPITFK